MQIASVTAKHKCARNMVLACTGVCFSGGNKRKLCMALAYIGLPRVVFLDEPTAGVDVVARSKIFSALKAIRSASGNSLVLTSHSMDECELACDRIGIMVAGQFKCLGTLQHLKGKFGKGYTLNVHLEDVSTTNVADFRAKVEKAFPGIELKEHRENVFDFHMEKKLPWSVLFAKVEELELMFSFDHVLVSESTLEQIFIGFARQQDEKKVERDNVLSTVALSPQPTRLEANKN
ncbi:phospholipid-transporting ATPase ABCA3 [Ixodes scapularis]|uniref:phospholipid-transporting ATPase ABCA3 n=1 Tax=Ixodes scapularis TaxID=6945 RepID=UPI001A9EDDBE|nr:phospholipid-transporting ATPase ABCA3 [Ixodes scapularis]